MARQIEVIARLQPLLDSALAVRDANRESLLRAQRDGTTQADAADIAEENTAQAQRRRREDDEPKLEGIRPAAVSTSDKGIMVIKYDQGAAEVGWVDARRELGFTFRVKRRAVINYFGAFDYFGLALGTDYTAYDPEMTGQPGAPVPWWKGTRVSILRRGGIDGTVIRQDISPPIIEMEWRPYMRYWKTSRIVLQPNTDYTLTSIIDPFPSQYVLCLHSDVSGDPPQLDRQATVEEVTRFTYVSGWVDIVGWVGDFFGPCTINNFDVLGGGTLPFPDGTIFGPGIGISYDLPREQKYADPNETLAREDWIQW